MPTTKYECWPKFVRSAADIKTVEVERETDGSVWIEGRRRAKDCEHKQLFDSWDAALSAAVRYHMERVLQAKQAIEDHEASIQRLYAVRLQRVQQG